MVRFQRLPPEMNQIRVTEDLPHRNGRNNRVQSEVNRDQRRCDPDGFPETLKENDAQTREKNESDAHLTFKRRERRDSG